MAKRRKWDQWALNLWKAFRLDFRLGWYHRLGYLVPVIILSVLNIYQGIYYRYDVLQDFPGFLELVFWGGYPPNMGQLDLCFSWIFLQVCLLFPIMNYMDAALYEQPEQYLLRIGYKSAWWVSKCLWAIWWQVFSFLSIIITAYLLAGMVSESWVPLLIPRWLAVQFLTHIAFSLISLVLTLMLSAQLPFIFLTALVTLAVFIDSPYYPWSAGMQARGYDIGRCFTSVTACLALAILAVIWGYTYCQKMDFYMRRGKNEG